MQTKNRDWPVAPTDQFRLQTWIGSSGRACSRRWRPARDQ